MCGQRLVLAGDIGTCEPASQLAFQAFRQKQCDHFARVCFVPGNHEVYHHSRGAALETMQIWQTGCPDCVLVDRRIEELRTGNTILLGSTLYLDISEIVILKLHGIEDFVMAGKWSQEQHNEAHLGGVDWHEAQLRSIAVSHPNHQVVLCTQFPPSMSHTSDPKFAKLLLHFVMELGEARLRTISLNKPIGVYRRATQGLSCAAIVSAKRSK